MHPPCLKRPGRRPAMYAAAPGNTAFFKIVMKKVTCLPPSCRARARNQPRMRPAGREQRPDNFLHFCNFFLFSKKQYIFSLIAGMQRLASVLAPLVFYIFVEKWTVILP